MRFLNKICVALSVALVAVLGVLSCGPARVAGTQVLFQADAADSIPYRIPTMAVMHSGDILALADYRLCGSDIGWGRVDIHGRISRNGGRSWGDEFVLIEGSGVSKATDCGFGEAISGIRKHLSLLHNAPSSERQHSRLLRRERKP